VQRGESPMKKLVKKVRRTLTVLTAAGFDYRLN
jgi:hypothetical protein